MQGNVTLARGHLLYTIDEPTMAGEASVLSHARHTNKVVKLGRNGSRFIFANILTRRGTIRFISAYAPHAGYPRETLEHFCDLLHGCMEEVRRFQFGLVVGGGFNTQLHLGFRGSLLNDLVDAFESFEFQIANDDNNHDFHMDMWTFESSMGLWTSGGELTFCCLVFVCHCYQHVPLIASTWVRTIVP